MYINTEEHGCLKTLIRKKFAKQENSKKNKLLPSLLTIAADIFEIMLDGDNDTECKPCLVKSSFENGETISKQFYMYKEVHKMIFELSEKLPDEIKISNQKLSPAEKSELKDRINKIKKDEPKAMGLIDLEADIIMKYYTSNVWEDKIVHYNENYVNCLPCIFFFNSDVLWCAIKYEMERQKKAREVVEAIRKCIEFYTLTDQVAKKNLTPDEKRIYYNKFHQIREIETTIADDSLELREQCDRAVIFTDAGSSGLAIIRQHVCSQMKNVVSMIKVLGIRNYIYIKKM